MESSLHRQLKMLYGGPAADVEVQVDGYRIDAVVRGKLFEIQQASLAALRDKVRSLLETSRRRGQAAGQPQIPDPPRPARW